ncbi:MAG TPA: dihydrodipicolinate synthase family protein [Woeseiaceae bacterium]|nr:dihydrodipicolinate synthase family protein [Woeseiaceae bacterium]
MNAVGDTGNSVAQQRHMVRFALAHGASCLILQPPAAGDYSSETCIDFFSDVADGFDATFAIQNAPQYLGQSLSDSQIGQLRARNPGFSVVKSESSAVGLASLVEALDSTMSVLNGRGGLEMIDCLFAGANGFILAPDVIDKSKRVVDLWCKGDLDAARNAYAEVLPTIVFVMQSIEHLICYGKRLYGLRSGIEIHDRSPAMAPSAFGIAAVERFAAKLGPIHRDQIMRP